MLVLSIYLFHKLTKTYIRTIKQNKIEMLQVIFCNTKYLLTFVKIDLTVYKFSQNQHTNKNKNSIYIHIAFYNVP